MEITTTYFGYVINVKSLLSDYPEKLAAIQEFYPKTICEDETDYKDCWCLPGDQILIEMQIFVEEEIQKDLVIDATGDWYGKFISDHPFEKDEVYAVFEDNIEVLEFMRKHNIPETKLLYQEWRIEEY